MPRGEDRHSPGGHRCLPRRRRVALGRAARSGARARDARALARRRVFRGRDAALGFFRRFSEAWDPSGYEYHDFEELGDHVLFRNRLRLHGRTAGLVGELEQWAVYTVRTGRIVRIHYFETRDEAVAEAGRR